jgi:N-acetylmuramoyl-L-alanine amidase
MFYRRILILFAILLGVALSVDGAAKRFTLCIDAGHGGNDFGAPGKVTKEKTLTLRYALAFGRIIEQNCPDVQVIYTRKTDRFIALWQRAEIANKAKADLFVSVHINALPKGHIARGYQTYTLGRSRRDGNMQGYIENLEVAKRENSVILYYEKDYQQHYEGFDPNSPESNIIFELMQDKNLENGIQLAKFMQKNICSATGRQDKGVHQDNLAVLRLTSMPACLMELGFISTPDEEQYLNSDRAVQQFSRGFYNAFVAYKNKVAPGIKVPYKPAPAVPETPKETKVPDNLVSPESSETPDGQGKTEKTEKQESPTTPEIPGLEPVTDAPVTTATTTKKPAASTGTAPVFKVQILVGSTKLKAGDSRFKGMTGVDFYKEGGMYKYTVGSSTNYQEIYQLRKSILNKFPQAFIIAFRDNEKMDVNEAISEYKRKKAKK